jgi:hypothetical protein
LEEGEPEAGGPLRVLAALLLVRRIRRSGGGHLTKACSVRRRVLNKYGRVQKFVLGTSYMYLKWKIPESRVGGG